MYRIILLLAVFVLLHACGGGGFTSAIDKPDLNESVTVSETDITSTSLDGTDTVSATFSCEINDLFSDKCEFQSVEVKYPTLGLSYTIPLGLSLSNKESVQKDIKIADMGVKNLEPFVYLRDTNPSTSSSEWTIKNEVIATNKTEKIAEGYEVCHDETVPPPNPDQPPTTKTVCVPGENFTGTIGNYLPGSLAIYAGSGQQLSETSFGLLTGNGSGSITKNYTGYSLTFSITGGVAKGSPVVASYLTTFSNVYAKGSLTLHYGDLTLTLDKGLMKDSGGNIYAIYDNAKGTFQWVKPIGARQSVVVASYEAEPWVAVGGEVVGYGDGVNSIYKVKTKYPFIKDGTLKVFANGPGTVLFYDPISGEATVKFGSVLPKNTAIKASYVIYKASVPVELVFTTKTGQQTKSLSYTLRSQ